MSNDIQINPDAFLGEPDPKVAESNRGLIKLQGTIPQWYEVGAANYRRMRENGETAVPGPKLLPEAQDVAVPSREAGRSIPCRLLLPAGQTQGQQPGVLLHIHGGGWVTLSEKWQDGMLKSWADATGLAVVSVGYRLAPEQPFPCGPEDCYDVAEYLVDRATKTYGGPLQFVGGESAGGNLAALTVLHLLQTRPAFRLRGTLLTYGAYNLATPYPSAYNWRLPLLLPRETMDKYIEAYVPNRSALERAHPSISPINAPIFDIDPDSQAGVGQQGLPPALFLCGTLDPLLDDTVLMAARWQMAGAAAAVKLFRGLPHGFNLFPDAAFPGSAEALARQIAFMQQHMQK